MDNKVYSNSVGLDTAASPTKQCPPSALQAMGNRLLDWFSVVMVDSSKRRRPRNKSKGMYELYYNWPISTIDYVHINQITKSD